ncbi:Stress response protein NhaX [bioreactor metagenome]|uniref:Stress response protein NhaX n=1 Tax=bioreactor metagenome TaxID=1076179 RepID=A0A644ZTC7_9ZZZZ
MNVKNILVAYDGSRQSQKALEWAVDISDKTGAKVTTVTVIKPPDFSPTGEINEFMYDAEKYYQPLLAKVKKFGSDNAVEINTVLLRGHPAETIVMYAEIDNADLIVTGTRGMGGFKSLVIGSVAQKVVTYAKVPVLIIKD